MQLNKVFIFSRFFIFLWSAIIIDIVAIVIKRLHLNAQFYKVCHDNGLYKYNNIII